MENIIIQYERYVPKSVIQHFVNQTKVKARLQYAGDVEDWEYDTGQAIADVTLILNNPYVSGLITSGIIAGLPTLYRKLKAAFKQSKKVPSIDLTINAETFNTKFSLVDNLSDGQIEPCFKELEKATKRSDLEDLSKNPNFHSKQSTKRFSSFAFDTESNLWLPSNFKNDKYWDDAEDRAKNMLD